MLEDTDKHPFLYYSDGDADVSEDSEEIESERIESDNQMEKGRDIDIASESGEKEKEEIQSSLFNDVTKKRVYHFEVPCTSHASVTRDPQTIHLAMQFIEAIRSQNVLNI